MATLERFFGIAVTIDSVLNPRNIANLEQRIEKLKRLAGSNLAGFSIYMHTLKMVETSGRFFGRSVPLQNRISSLEVDFQVNEKQRRSGQIRFYNFAIDDCISGDSVAGVSYYLIKRVIPSGRLRHKASFQTELVTCINNTLRRDKFRKIKVRVHVHPTAEYEDILRMKDRKYESYLDLELTKDVKLLLPGLASAANPSVQLELDLLDRFSDESAITKKQAISPYFKYMMPPSTINLSINNSPGAMISGTPINTGNHSSQAVSTTATTGQSLEEVLSFLKSTISDSSMSTFEKEDASDALCRIEQLSSHKQDKGVLERVNKKVGLIEGILKKSEELWNLCGPFVAQLPNFFQ